MDDDDGSATTDNNSNDERNDDHFCVCDSLKLIINQRIAPSKIEVIGGKYTNCIRVCIIITAQYTCIFQLERKSFALLVS